jgi:hypothetical protein
MTAMTMKSAMGAVKLLQARSAAVELLPPQAKAVQPLLILPTPRSLLRPSPYHQALANLNSLNPLKFLLAPHLPVLNSSTSKSHRVLSTAPAETMARGIIQVIIKVMRVCMADI